MKNKFCRNVSDVKFCAENRLAYVAGEGTPGVPGGQGIDLEQAQKALAETDALRKQAEQAIDTYATLKAQKDREDFQKTLEQTPADKEKLFAKIAEGLNTPLVLPPQDADFSKLHTLVYNEASAVALTFDDNFWNSITATASDLVKSLKHNELAAQVFADEIVRQVKIGGDLTTRKSFKIKYADKKISVELSDQGVDAVVAVDPNEPPTPESEADAKEKKDIKDAKNQIFKNESLKAIIEFFGLNKDQSGNVNWEGTVLSFPVKVLGWFFGAEFAKGAIDPLIKAAGARWPGAVEKATELQGTFQGFAKTLLSPDQQPTVLPKFLSGLNPSWKTAGIDKAVSLGESETVRVDEEFFMSIPEGKTVDLKTDAITLRYVENGALYSLEKGVPITAREGGLKLKLGGGQTIPKGAVFDGGVMVWKEQVKDSAAAGTKAPEAPAAEAVAEADKARAEEAPTETPAA